MTDSILKEDLSQYLTPTSCINSDDPRIVQKAIELTKGCTSDGEKARILYEFVRDSYTDGAAESFVASDVLEQGGNLCYQRSILLAALCRSVGIPARLHLQKVSIKSWHYRDGRIKDINFAHGLTDIFLNGAWKVYEATGNSAKWLQWTGEAGVVVGFDPDQDCLFDMGKNPRITGELLPIHFADRTDEMVKIIEQINDF